MFLVAVYKSPRGLWSDTDITELVCFRNKPTLAGDLNAKHSVRNSKISDSSGLKLLKLFVSLYVLGIVVHQKVRPSEVTATDILDSDHMRIMFSIMDPVRTKETLDLVENWQTGSCFKASLLNWYRQIS
jgi:hypothetical protein